MRRHRKSSVRGSGATTPATTNTAGDDEAVTSAALLACCPCLDAVTPTLAW